MWYPCVVVVLFMCSAISANSSVTVISMQLELGRNYDIDVNNTVEYILEFTPRTGSAHRVRVSSDGGDVTRPVLVIVRHISGSRTLQLPYYSGPLLLHELEHTLCPSYSAARNESDDGDCGPPSPSLSLHVWTSCARSLRVSLAVRPEDLLLPADVTSEVTATVAAAAVRGYRWPSEGPPMRGVLLRVDSDDDVCATIAILDYNACPIEETLSTLSTASTRFTMLQNGGVHLLHSRFPSGFLIVAIVHPDESACEEDADVTGDELWQDAVLGGGPTAPPPPQQRTKVLRYTVMPAISPGQYAIAAASTLAALALFYLAFFGLVMAQRIPGFYKFVAPKRLLVVSPENGSTTQTQVDSTSPVQRSRRLSTATFDSSDNSDTDEEDEVTSPPGITSETRSMPREDILKHQSQTPNNEGEQIPGEADLAIQPLDSQTATNDVATRTEAVTLTTVVDNYSDVQNGGGNIERIETVTGGQPQPQDGQNQATPPLPNATAFNLPPRLRLAALARRRERTLRARSRRYLHALLTVAVFYALPVLQLVTAFQLILNASGSLDLCYYNFLCALPAGVVSDFNHVFSNVAYLLLGALLLLIVRRRQKRRKQAPLPPNYGIPEHFGLMEALGAGMMMVALLSAAYHVCPNRLNFQFDTAFMYVLAVISNVKMYQSRHPDVNARAHATFGVLAVIIAFGVWGVLGGGALFWGLWTVIHVFSVLMLSLRVYYVGQWRLGTAAIGQTAATIRGGGKPLYATRLAALLVINAVNWAFALYGLILQLPDFAGHLLSVLLCNALLHMCYYLGMKLASGERLRWYSSALTSAAAVTWAPALYLFVAGSSDWSTTPARSRLRNHACLVLRFYDAHDLWHLLSAVALFLSFTAMLTWDDGLAATRREDIHVF